MTPQAFCGVCGAARAPDAAFCGACGAQFDVADSHPTRSPTDQQMARAALVGEGFRIKMLAGPLPGSSSAF